VSPRLGPLIDRQGCDQDHGEHHSGPASDHLAKTVAARRAIPSPRVTTPIRHRHRHPPSPIGIANRHRQSATPLTP
jgi:hypothetical protein